MRQIFKCIAATAIAACFASCEKSYEELDPQFPAISDGKSVAISSGETRISRRCAVFGAGASRRLISKSSGMC